MIKETFVKEIKKNGWCVKNIIKVEFIEGTRLSGQVFKTVYLSEDICKKTIDESVVN